MSNAATRVLDISDLHIRFSTTDTDIHAVRGVSCHINAGECLGIVGESGSGKSQTFLAAMGLLANNGHCTGRVNFHDHNLIDLNPVQLNSIRGDRVSMIFQDPLTSLTPHLRIGQQMREVLHAHQHVTGSEANTRCLHWLDRMRIPDARRRMKQYPHQLSGGMRQRVMIAMSMLCGPELLIADEPTTALDVTIQAEILEIMDELRRDQGTAIALITHDMGVVARMCDRVQVMRSGEFVEQGSCEDIFYRPQHQYTRMLLDAVPRIPLELSGKSNQQKHVESEKGLVKNLPASRATGENGLLQVVDINVQFRISSGLLSRACMLRAVDNVSFDLHAGETLGIVGESGSGKSTLARAILQLIAPTSGSVSWLGSSLTTISAQELKKTRRDLQIVFQDPLASLNPSMTIGDSISEPLAVFEPAMTRLKRTQVVADIMQRVGLDYGLINRYPHELSGGQNQRVGIARAMILKPQLLICDEAVSALDVSIQAQILELLKDLQREFGLSLIFISHDLSVVWEISHRILVMYLGSVVEHASRNQLFSNPQHPYTQQLISSVPIPDPSIERSRTRIKLKGELTSPMDPMARLRFMPGKINGTSANYVPQLEQRFPGHFVAEHEPLESLLIGS